MPRDVLAAAARTATSQPLCESTARWMSLAKYSLTQMQIIKHSAWNFGVNRSYILDFDHDQEDIRERVPMRHVTLQII